MQLTRIYARAAVASLFSLAALVPASSLAAVASLNSVPRSVSFANDHGRVDLAKQITVTVHLTKENETGFLKAVDALYEPGSPTYHKWMTDEDLKQYSPSPDKIQAVRQELESHGLTVLDVDPHGFTIRARGPVSSVEAAFGTELHQFDYKGKVFQANVKPAHLAGPAGNYVSVVAGLESHQAHTLAKRAINLKTGQPLSKVPFASAKAVSLSTIMTDQALSPVTDFTFLTPGASLPVGGYKADVYDINPNLAVSFTPSQLEAAYGLYGNGLPGYTGAGQTIVLLEGYGYPTAQADANAYFSITGLPQLNSSNFSVIYPEGTPSNPLAGIEEGWDIEIALDIQSAHSIAPGAKIVVVASPGQDDNDFQYSMSYIINHNIGTTVSNSWELDSESFSGPAESQAFENILILGAAKGVSFQFSTGDSGDDGIGQPLGSSEVPSNAPHATAVGGTTLINSGSGFRATGWGDDVVLLNDDGVLDPPEQFGFEGGAGGGESLFFPKPKWQSALKGTGRQTPDISALADPYTGVALVITDPTSGEQFIEPGWGGTSLAAPIITAFWAIAQQKAGGPLGQASPLISTLTSAALTDVVPYTPGVAIDGFITDSAGTTEYTAADLFAGLIGGNTGYTTAIWEVDGGLVDYGFAFGLDSSLTVTKGFDNVTGYGTPRGTAFINAVAAKK
jgi:subtilase family serine protease